MPLTNGPELITKTAAILERFTPEMHARLVSLFPTPESFAELNNRMETNYPAALKGDPEKLKAFEADQKAAASEYSLLIGLAKVLATKDAPVPETLGLGRAAEKTAAATIPLTHPLSFRLIFDQKGQLFASCARVSGAKGYQVWACDGDPSIEGNWKLISSSPSCKGILISGLNRAKFNVLRIRAMRGHSAGPWSNWVSLEPN